MRIRGHRQSPAEMDMTPMIDVVFQLLIFFLITAQLIQQAAPLILPRERGNPADAAGSMGLVVNLAPDGAVIVLERRVEPAQLEAMTREFLAREPKAVPVVRADRGASAKRLNEIITGLRKGGCKSVRIATDPSGGEL